MKSKKIPALLAALLMTLVGTVTAKTFIASSFYDRTHPLTKYGYAEWAENLKIASNGELEAQVFSDGVLLAPRANLQGIRDNIVQVGTAPGVFTPAELPIANALQELGFNYSDALTIMLATTDFSMNHPAQLAEWKKNGIIFLGGYSTPVYFLICRMPVTNMAELKGKRIRAPGAAIAGWLEQAGAVPVNVPASESYTGLDRGSLDCTTGAGNDLIDRSLWEVGKHTTLAPTGLNWSGPLWGVNIRFWQGLSDAQRELMKDTMAKAMTRTMVLYQKASETALDEAAARGNTIHQPSADLLASIAEFRQQRAQEIKQVSAEKYNVTDGSIIDDFIATHEKWVRLLADIDTQDEAALAELALEHIYRKLPANYGME